MKFQMNNRRSQLTKTPFPGIKMFFYASSLEYTSVCQNIKILHLLSGDGML